MKEVLVVVTILVVLVMGNRLAAAETQLVEDFDRTWQDGRWQFSNGPEFPGAKGRFDRVKESPDSDRWVGRLTFDFQGGGNYVAAVLPLKGAPEIAAVRLRLKRPKGRLLTFRYTDPTGQTVQKQFEAPDDAWASSRPPGLTYWPGIA